MRYRLILPIAVLLAALVAVPAAQAKVRVGLSEQSPAMFDQANWTPAQAQASSLHLPVGLREARRQPRRGHRLHERRAREAARGARHLLRHARLLRQQPVLEEEGVQGAEPEGLQGRGQGLPQGVPLRQDVHAVERGQPRLPADVQEAQAGREVLQDDEERLQGLHRHGGRRARLERRQDLPAQVPARVQGQGPHLGPAQLQGRQPPARARASRTSSPWSRARSG